MMRLRFPAWLVVAMATTLFAPGCSCSGDETVGASGTGSTETASGGGSSDGGTASSGSGAGGGAGGGASSARAATDTVSAGEVAKSQRYRMLFTLGQPTQNQQTSTSPGYRMQGGLVGANGSSP